MWHRYPGQIQGGYLAPSNKAPLFDFLRGMKRKRFGKVEFHYSIKSLPVLLHFRFGRGQRERESLKK